MGAPLIGITTRHTANEGGTSFISSPKSYVQALARAGAVPVLIPLDLPEEVVGQIVAALDGVLFSGGGDIQTARFGGADHPQVYDVDVERDRVEMQLVGEMTRTGKPFLGICRGLQVVNVALGGTLYTHIADQLQGALEHDCHPGWPYDYIAHEVEVQPESRLGEITGESRLQVNSLHHQGVAELASGLAAAARAPDGLVEALELPGHPFGLAVQWHPEYLLDDPSQMAIVAAFVRAARKKVPK